MHYNKYTYPSATLAVRGCNLIDVHFALDTVLGRIPKFGGMMMGVCTPQFVETCRYLLIGISKEELKYLEINLPFVIAHVRVAVVARLLLCMSI